MWEMGELTPLRIREALGSDFATVAQLIARQNRSSRYRCLHSDEGSTQGVLLTLNRLAEQESLALVCALDQAGRVIGAVGAELDIESRRAWLWGPFAEGGDSEPGAWKALCEQLYSHLLDTLPFEPKRLDGFIEQSFEQGASFYESCGFSHAETNYVFVAVRPAEIASPPTMQPFLTPELFEPFCKLFDVVFPKTFYTGSQVVDRISHKEQVFVYTEGGGVLGFCHVSINESANEGYIEFVGVDPQQQGRGIAKKLLQTSMYWLFIERGMPQIGLSTGDDNFQAHALYRGVGFELEHTGLSYRKVKG